MTDLRQSKNYAKYMESLGWIVEGGAFIKKFWFTSIIKAQHFEKINLDLIKKYHPFLIKLEPLKEINLPGFKKDNWPLIPSKTIILDLKNISLSKDVRYEIRKAEKAGVFISFIRGGLANSRDSQDHLLQSFIKSWHQHASQKGFWVPLHKEIRNLATAFEKDCFLFLTYLRRLGDISLSTPVSGALFLKNNSVVHYMYAFSTSDGRKFSAQYLLLSKALEYFKKIGIKKMDLEGIYDERYPDSTKNWQGFTKFKMGWGGKIITYPGSWTKYSLPFVFFTKNMNPLTTQTLKPLFFLGLYYLSSIIWSKITSF